MEWIIASTVRCANSWVTWYISFRRDGIAYQFSHYIPPSVSNGSALVERSVSLLFAVSVSFHVSFYIIYTGNDKKALQTPQWRPVRNIKWMIYHYQIQWKRSYYKDIIVVWLCWGSLNNMVLGLALCITERKKPKEIIEVL